ncbi:MULTISPECIES: TetR family transcriptional regulator [Mycolicibacterium]|uniref:TetR family transcriptional regulator n=1 Tax=Mycolicibacterium monacense TaxID=85693 RepID=UPI0007EA13CA|nr:TetR family transcriptional regulator [Mycolicibacterium monacense]OBB76435.1 TetR family transcriptional regulator [Mycolicibacterium monacense]OBF48493.1 TetR family transcriptional regulator [Mycolicibacterium monacense]
MVRWQPDARGRLEQAALELYAERGFDGTTVADIADRAGLTERTFFRYFADKREALFGGQTAMIDLMVKAVAAAPDSVAPIEAVASALNAVAATFDGRLDDVRRRQAVIAATPALQERESSKLALLAAALTDALRARDVAETTARLAAETGVAVFRIAFERWVAGGDQRDLAQHIRELLDELATMTARPATT